MFHERHDGDWSDDQNRLPIHDRSGQEAVVERNINPRGIDDWVEIHLEKPRDMKNDTQDVTKENAEQNRNHAPQLEAGVHADRHDCERKQRDDDVVEREHGRLDLAAHRVRNADARQAQTDDDDDRACHNRREEFPKCICPKDFCKD